jgi:hypothetical protein
MTFLNGLGVLGDVAGLFVFSILFVGCAVWLIALIRENPNDRRVGETIAVWVMICIPSVVSGLGFLFFAVRFVKWVWESSL